jgi:hypothetical protein
MVALAPPFSSVPTPPSLMPGSAAFREALRPRSAGRRPAARSRQAMRVAPARLLEVLNHELAARAECEGLRLGARKWEIEEGAAGCNWAESSLIVRVHGTTRPGAFPALRQVVAEIRAGYDLLPSST